jgi:hypothetical protein
VKRQEWAKKGHGEYTELEEKEFFKVGARVPQRPSAAYPDCSCWLPPPPLASQALPAPPATATAPPWLPLPQEIKGEERMVVHFYRNSLPCKAMDQHLALLAAKHMETKFVRVHAEKAPFLTGGCCVVMCCRWGCLLCCEGARRGGLYCWGPAAVAGAQG